MKQPPHEERSGILFAAAAYMVWGLLPIYWHMLQAVPPVQLTAWRVTLTAALLLALTAWRGRLALLVKHIANPSLILRLGVSASLIGVNWTIYVYSIASHQLVEASLGYFILPLISIALGVGLLRERISRLRMAGIGLMLAAVLVQVIALGNVPWIALGLALTFGFYGYVRKLAPVGPIEGLLIETGLLLPIALVLLGTWARAGALAVSFSAPSRDALLLCSGPFTALPLTMFAAGARRIRLSTLGLLQYLSPTISLVIALAVFAEPFRLPDALSFACVWMGLALVAGEGQLARARLWLLTGR